MNDRPIGVFDSGIGGLTVVREIMRELPGESLVYFGDTARVPYGNKSRETVIRYSRQIAHFLMEHDVKAIVIACNTASAYALDALSGEIGIPVIGVIHAGAKTAVETSRNGRIGVIGTQGTVSSGIYPRVIREMRSSVQVLQKACPLFVPLAEEGWWDDEITRGVEKRYLSGLKDAGVDTLVLGCTHYPLLRGSIAAVMGEKVRLVNPAHETAVELRGILEEKGLRRQAPDARPRHEFYVSDLADRFRDFANAILTDKSADAMKITDIEKY